VLRAVSIRHLPFNFQGDSVGASMLPMSLPSEAALTLKS
jgi:hypothetical protein